MKKLYRSEENKIWGGVIGGIGEYLEVDPTILRVIWILIIVFTAFVPGIVVYLLALTVIPRKKNDPAVRVEKMDAKEEGDR